MSNSYIFNLETTKIELHFEKSEYDSLTEQQKRDLKSAFLWSNARKAWVSRAKEPNLWRAKHIAKALGFSEEERVGERISFEEQLEQKAERAEARAERYEQYAHNAEKRGEALQKPLNDMRGDIAFFTQPNINSSSGRAFTNYRNKLFDRYGRGFDEYRKSEYFRGRAETARSTAAMEKLNDIGYLDRKIKEIKKGLKQRFESVQAYEKKLLRIESGETITRYDGTIVTADEIAEYLQHNLELIEVETDKLAFFMNALEERGGIKFSKENIKVGDIVIISPWGKCEIVSTGRVNVKYKVIGLNFGNVLTAAYAEIKSVISGESESEGIKDGEKLFK